MLPQKRNPQIGGPSTGHYLSLSEIELDSAHSATVEEFRTDRYFWINEYRWRLLLQTGIPLKGKVIFEPGAGIGDQTAWLLSQGAKQVFVSEGRDINVGVIERRFRNDPRVNILLGDLENCLDKPEFNVKADLIYMWGVYYHINDPLPDFAVLKKLARIADTLVMDYQESLTGSDYIEEYSYNNTSASISHSSWRQTRETMARGVSEAFGFAYFPVEQMDWMDPSCLHTPRRIIVGSTTPLNLPGLVAAR